MRLWSSFLSEEIILWSCCNTASIIRCTWSAASQEHNFHFATFSTLIFGAQSQIQILPLEKASFQRLRLWVHIWKFFLTRVFLRSLHNTQLSWISTDFNSCYSGWWRYQLNTKLIFIIELYSPPHTSPSIQVKFLTSNFVLRIFMIFVKKNEVIP